MSASVFDMSNLSPETQAAIKAGTDIIAELVLARDDLVTLTSFMAGDDYSDGSNYSAGDIAYAVEKPWKFADVLAEAKADLAAQVTS